MAYTLECKLLLVGDSGVGKTAFVSRFYTDQFQSRYLQTVGIEVNSFAFDTNFGPTVFQCWEISRDEMLTDHKCMDAHCGIIMFDVTSRVTFQNVAKWYRDIVRVCGEIPIVLCGNKVDAANSRTRVKQLNLDRTVRLPYFEISAASQYHRWDRHFEPFDHLPSDPLAPPDEHLEDPLEWLTRKLFGDDNLMLLEPVVPDPRMPEITLTIEQIAQLEAENAAAATALPLPDEDEDL